MNHSQELFEIFAGTYEEFLLGFKFLKNEDGYKLEQTVADHTHKGSIRAINARGNLLATGGFDEIIHIYNLDENREVGTLAQHTGTVTCLAFTSDEKHLISCGEDGTIAIYRIGSWIMEKLWNKAHKGTNVNWIAVHPSNKMAFSVGNDGNLRTWNLIDGTPAFVTNISHLTKRPELVVWSPNGELYAVPYENEISVFTVKSANIKHSFKLENKITCTHFVQNDKLCLGDMCGNLVVYDLASSEVHAKHQVGDVRIKSVVSHGEHVIIATSKGLVAVYGLTDEGLCELAKNDSSCRITCLAISCHCHRREKKQKRKKEVNGEVKTEITVEMKKKIAKKKNINFTKTDIKKSPEKKRKVECSPRRQSWIVQEQDP